MNLIKNIEDYKDNKEVYFILKQLEAAHDSKDGLSASILLKRLENYNLCIKCVDEDTKPIVQ